MQLAYLYLPVLAGHVDLETIAGVWHLQLAYLNLPVLAGHLDLETIAGVWHLQSAYLYLPVLAKHVDLETIAGVQHVQPAYLFLPVLAGHVDLETIAGVWHGAACLPQYPISHWTCRSGDHRWGAARCSLLTYYLPVLAGHVDLETIAGVRHMPLTSISPSSLDM